MNKLIITRWNGSVITLLQSGRETVQVDIEPENNRPVLGNIYIGKVNHIVKNINAAFVDIGKGQMGYLSLNDAWIHFADQRPYEGKLRQGDEIIVQVERDAVKTKAPVLTGNLNITGRYFVLTSGKKQIGFSTKIADQAWKQEIKQDLESRKEESFGIIVRTNAYKVPKAELESELVQLKKSFKNVLDNGKHRTCYSLLYSSAPSYLTGLRDSLKASLEAVVTDEADIYDAVKDYLVQYQPGDLRLLTWYEDRLLPLGKLYRIEKTMEEALGKRVWLKSGGYLVIEPTEALVVIDVNTGKYSGKKEHRETIKKVNLEAAEEIGHQLRLRNLSGIIIIDFIDMEAEEDKRILMERLEEIVSKDPVKTTVVEMTKLNLVEVTRKKIRKPLYEQALQMKEKVSL
ncbi:ribonuclease E/G [Lacrimispora saccharolytica]|uniref:RNA-binding protein AU-1/Ribonuclease E/G n=1 Tax=Lacrimispora saccharolytica (strain ATCC 35040 / DSM 2544 / NRCC 2533 / WM1) TaxID=610130 RepID=D9R128_LACSW|nr:ribonuclease E/G [Lacrimispora saccharolytica]ADL04575.1 RNA-binding protein AU-1/Ribonuclease E/G [[Clostridium] saccharolyticum WM1]QRV21179.1 ribonuclease E/G [Lacrimispora saccharolytica]